jgi:DNA invertase Pin-like site-specific DNA recombinase
MNKGMRVGYIRVSTVDQNIERQLENVPLDKSFIDKCSGKDLNRPQFESMMNFVREGDRVIIDSFDRLARNVDHLRTVVKTLNSKGVEVEFIKYNLLFKGDDSPMSNLILTIIGAIHEFELSLIKERQREGIKIARAKGVYKRRGRDRALKSEEITQLKSFIQEGMNKCWIARKFGITRHTVYKYLKESNE